MTENRSITSTFKCDDCERILSTDYQVNFGDEGGPDQCEECYDAWFAAEYAYWKPLYDGEKAAGLL